MGRSPRVVPFAEQYGVGSGAIVSGVDLVRGVGMLLGWERIDAPGSTAYLDTDYASKGRTGAAALADHDIVCVHVEAPDEASHEGRADAKVEALERIDSEIVGPLRAALEPYGEYRILVTPDPPHAGADEGALARGGPVRHVRRGGSMPRARWGMMKPTPPRRAWPSAPATC